MNYFKLAADTWANAATFRATRKRLKDYAYSRQWEDLTTTPEGKIITEGGLVREDGRLPRRISSMSLTAVRLRNFLFQDA